LIEGTLNTKPKTEKIPLLRGVPAQQAGCVFKKIVEEFILGE